jgi:hypothetical protein
LEPSGKGARFLQRLQVDGTFGVPSERISDQASAQKLSAFSQRAQGIKPPKSGQVSGDFALGNSALKASADVLSSFEGQAKIRDGILSTQRITFRIPGAEANLNGSFNLHDETVHLFGELRMDSDISHVTTGFKSLLLKPLVPLFKKDQAGAVIPIAVTGSPGRYKVVQDLAHRK